MFLKVRPQHIWSSAFCITFGGAQLSQDVRLESMLHIMLQMVVVSGTPCRSRTLSKGTIDRTAHKLPSGAGRPLCPCGCLEYLLGPKIPKAWLEVTEVRVRRLERDSGT